MYPASYSPRSRAVEIDDAGLRVTAPLSPATWNLAVQITAPGQTYTVDIYAGTAPEFRIDWGDGVVEFFTTIGLKTHIYQLVKTHTVKISGRFLSSGNIRLGSNAADRAQLIGTGVIPFIPGLANFLSTFQNTGLRSIPTDLFRYNTQVSTNGFYATFYGCTNLTGSIPTDLFRYNTQVSTNGFYSAFLNCSNLTGSIPTDLFRYNTQVSVSGFYTTFFNCSNLSGSIPTDLFRYNTLVSTSGFYQTLRGCTNLSGSIPTDLFRYNTQVSVNGFNQTFLSCSNLTGSIPTDLFRYNTQVSTNGFYSAFLNCSNLTGSIPTDLFRYNTQVSVNGFFATFNSCRNLSGSIPTDLFRYNTQCTSFNSAFYLCFKLQQNANIFYVDGEQATRFLNQSVDFTNCFRVTSYTGDQGVAPDLWNCTFGTGTPIKTDCWQGHSVSTVSNFADIPADWT